MADQAVLTEAAASSLPALQGLAALGGPIWLGVVIAAGITALVTVTGWLYTDWRRRAEALIERHEKKVDLQKALHAEISAHLHQLARWESEGAGQETIALILQGGDAPVVEPDDRAARRPDRRYSPLLPGDRHDRVFGALLDAIHVLDTDTIGPVVAYYHQIAMVADLADMIRSAGYAQVSAERRAKAYAHYVAMKADVRGFGDRALAAIDAAIVKPAPRLGFFSSLGAVR